MRTQENETIYLDWNVLNKLWKYDSQNEKDRDDFSVLEKMFDDDLFMVPYSNAHIRDLSRGVIKHPEFAEVHIKTIVKATRNICITQYWGDLSVTWHIRDPREFLNSTIKDQTSRISSFDTLFDGLDDTGVMQALHSVSFSLLDMQELPENFKECYKADPIFSIIFPKSKVKNTLRSLSEDLYNFSGLIMSDNTIYRKFRKYLNTAKARSAEVRAVANKLGVRFPKIGPVGLEKNL